MATHNVFGRRHLVCEQLERRELLAADFLSFSVVDASGDDSAATAFESSALSLSYEFDPDGQTLLGVDVFARKDGRTLKIAEHTASDATDLLISLDGFSDFSGVHEVFATASTADGGQTNSSIIALEVLPTTSVFGDFRGETLGNSATPGGATVVYGDGGTDTLLLDVGTSAVASFNGAALSAFQANSLATTQAIYAGTAFDYLRLTDGREIYFHGIEWLEFAGGDEIELQTRTNDTRFDDQWNLTIGDITDAWRFTRGSDDVLLVSIDTGIPTSGGTHTFSDLDPDRLSFFGNASGTEHGHQAVSLMAAQPNNNDGIAGINWESPVLVLDVYGGDAGNIGINTAINAGINQLNATSATRVVYQGGIQGEFWLNILQDDLIPSIADRALFAVAAGNGGQDISIPSHPDGLSAGVARLEGVYDNVIAVGALVGERTTPAFFPGFPDFSNRVRGQVNATDVRLSGTSNFGDNLTFAAPTASAAEESDGFDSFFTGTSGANPIVAGIASLVWSIDPSLTPGQVRGLLAETATDLGAPGRDPQFGHGNPNAGAAVRRAWALAENGELASLAENPFSVGPDLTGDYNADSIVSAADYAVWRDTLGSAGVQYAGADGDGSTVIDGEDHVLWSSNFGRQAPVLTDVDLIDAATGNGSFEDLTDATPDRGGNRIGGRDVTATIPGWTATAGGFGGFDDDKPEGSTNGTQYAFVNSGGNLTLVSDALAHTTLEGDEFTLTFDVGSNKSNSHDYTASLAFGGQARQLASFSDNTNATSDGLTTYSFTYTATAADAGTVPSIQLFMDNNGGDAQTYIDNVRLRVATLVDPSAAPAASAGLSVAAAGAVAGSHPGGDAPADRPALPSNPLVPSEEPPATGVTPAFFPSVSGRGPSGTLAGNERGDVIATPDRLLERDEAFDDLLLVDSLRTRGGLDNSLSVRSHALLESDAPEGDSVLEERFEESIGLLLADIES